MLSASPLTVPTAGATTNLWTVASWPAVQTASACSASVNGSRVSILTASAKASATGPLAGRFAGESCRESAESVQTVVQAFARPLVAPFDLAACVRHSLPSKLVVARWSRVARCALLRFTSLMNSDLLPAAEFPPAGESRPAVGA